jgi:4'-phosphopantetheinyl transferase
MSVTIEVVRIELDAMERRDINVLTTWAEREGAARRRYPADSRRFLARRAAMRLNAASILGMAPTEILLKQDAFGRPEISGGQIHISQSSRGGVMIAAFCADRVVGCDLEEIRADIDVDAIAALCFGPTEQRMLQAAIPPLKLKVFYDFWTRKEAYLKATGTGLAVNMTQFEITHRPGPATSWGRVDWTSDTWHPTPAHVAAVVARGSDWIIVHRDPVRMGTAAMA